MKLNNSQIDATVSELWRTLGQKLSQRSTDGKKSPRVRVERDVAKAFLMYGNFVYGGQIYEPKFKHLGLGVYECFAEVAVLSK